MSWKWEGFSQCYPPGPACWVNWNAWATIVGALVGLATIAVAYLAWRTSLSATEIARQQHQTIEDERKANARIIGRLLLNEITAMPARAYSIQRAWEGAINWTPSVSIKNSAAFEFALREAQLSVVPSAEQVESRIHTLPDSIGADLATLIGASRQLNHIAERIAAKVRPPMRAPLGFASVPLYAGDMEDFTLLLKSLIWFDQNGPQLANEFRDFVGVARVDYSDKNFDRPLG